MAQNTQKINGTFHTTISHFGVGPWDDSIFIPAGLRLEGNTSAQFFDFGEYPLNRDRYMRHLEFRTPEMPIIRDLAASGSALLQFFELEEYSAQKFNIDEASPVVSQPVGQMAVQYAHIRKGMTL